MKGVGCLGQWAEGLQGLREMGLLPTSMEIFEACSSWNRCADVYQLSNRISGIKGGSTISFSFLEGGRELPWNRATLEGGDWMQ